MTQQEFAWTPFQGVGLDQPGLDPSPPDPGLRPEGDPPAAANKDKRGIGAAPIKEVEISRSRTPWCAQPAEEDGNPAHQDGGQSLPVRQETDQLVEINGATWRLELDNGSLGKRRPAPPPPHPRTSSCTLADQIPQQQRVHIRQEILEHKAYEEAPTNAVRETALTTDDVGHSRGSNHCARSTAGPRRSRTPSPRRATSSRTSRSKPPRPNENSSSQRQRAEPSNCNRSTSRTSKQGPLR